MELLAVVILLLMFTVEVGSVVDVPAAGRVFIRLAQVMVVFESLLLLVFPAFNHELLGVKNARALNFVWAAVMIFDAVQLTVRLAKGGSYPVACPAHFVHAALMQAVFVYTFVLLLLKRKDFDDTEFRSLIGVYLAGLAILSVVMTANYFPARFGVFLIGMEPEMQGLFLDYFGKSIFLITANVILVIVITGHAVVQPFFLVQIDSRLMDSLSLTPREMEIILLLIEGYTKREVGEKLFISEFTVKTHIQNIYAKLGVTNRVELTNFIKEKSAATKAS